ncbi:MAG TPA: hypothetical protein VH186_31465 [Chloroflexia bacterium]|nr:hypothetical protein [Chloroflexia bacterium]
MTNPAQNENAAYSDSPANISEWYDDLPPASNARFNSFRSMLTSLLLNEVQNTLLEVNRALAMLEEIEKKTATRQAISGETLPSPLTEGFIQMIKRSGLDETVREQLNRLQDSAFRANLEATLRQYWQDLRAQSNRLRTMIKEQGKQTVFKPEEYSGEETTTATPEAKTAPSQPLEVAVAEAPARELLVDLFDEPTTGEIVLVAEHPSLQVNSIHVALHHDILLLTATDLNGQSYSKECLLPGPVEPNSLAQKYRNGVLEVRLTRLTPLG